MNPEVADRLPLERFWSTLKRLADSIQSAPYLRDDPVALGGARLIYDLSCPATRRSFVSAAREMALDPAFGRAGVWNRLSGLAVPAAFFWGGRDRLVSMHNNEHVSDFLPSAEQRVLPCLAHALNGGHHRCLAEAVADLLSGGLVQRAAERLHQTDPRPVVDVACKQPDRRRGCQPMGSRSTTPAS
jgi:pimeloyl-ACP methyl ester carboxylesterase